MVGTTLIQVQPCRVTIGQKPAAENFAGMTRAPAWAIGASSVTPKALMWYSGSTAATEVPSEAWLWKFYQAEFPDVPVTAQVHGGPVWQRIVETAAVEKADLIVMATRGHDSLADRMIGSNTERVVRHAPCPVLVV